jgi:GWxTD domain-containing protein
MKIRNFLTALAVTAVSASAFGALSGQYQDWGTGPVQLFFTSEENAQWKAVQTDEQAKAFIALFWARRDPTPDTPLNEFRTEIESRIMTADKEFAHEKVRGALSDRGRILVLYGKPTKIERVSSGVDPSITDSNADPRTQDRGATIQQWTYEDATTKDIFGISKAAVRFSARAGDNNIYTLEPSRVNLKKAQEQVVKLAVKQPNLTAPPTFRAPAPAVPVAVAPAAPVVLTDLKTPALTEAITAFKAADKNPYEGKLYSSWNENVTGLGETFVPVMVFVPKTAAIATPAVTFFGVIQDAQGKNVAAFEEPATLQVSKDEQYVDKTLAALPAGTYKGYFGLADASGKPIAISSSDMTLRGSIDKGATEISQAIISNNLYPLDKPQAPTDPFAYGGIKVVPKADHVFRSTDELWYFFELRNPGLPEPAADAPVAVSADAPAVMPKIQVKIDIEGTTDAEKKKIKMSAPLREVEVIPMRGVEGHYGVGNAIPLETFKPGEYTIKIKAIDMVTKNSKEMEPVKFRVVQ